MDEKHYIWAAEAVLRGDDLEGVDGWYYPAPLAYMFAGGLCALGERGLLCGLRALNLLGMSCVWLLAAQILLGRVRKPWAAVLLVPLLAWVSNSYWCLAAGNVSGIIALPLLVAMRPEARGITRTIAMGASAMFKPYALGLALRERGVARWIPLAAIALMSATTKVGTSPEDFILQLQHSPTLARAMVDIGLPWQVALLVALAALAVARWDGEMTRSQGLVISWLALPVVWPHTTAVLLLIPLALAFRGTAREVDPQRRLLRRLGVALLAAILLQADAFALEIGGVWWIAWCYSLIPPTTAAVLFVLLRPPRR